MELTLISNSETFNGWEKDWILSLLPEANLITDQTYEYVEGPNPIIVLSGAINHLQPAVSSWFNKFPQPPGLIHLSDEFSAHTIDFYSKCAFILRNYYRPEVAEISKYLPLGYRSGLLKFTQPDLKIEDRPLTWCFAGDYRVKRESMLANANQIPKGYSYLANGFIPGSIAPLDVKNYAELLNNSQFSLCPAGNLSMDTFRLYESLEAGSIPIVEDTKGYFLNIYPDFPCPIIKDWNNLKKMLAEVEYLQPEHLEQTRKTIQYWWNCYKANLKNELKIIISKYAQS